MSDDQTDNKSVVLPRKWANTAVTFFVCSEKKCFANISGSKGFFLLFLAPEI